MHRVTDRSHDLRSAIEASGYYPDVVAEAVFAAVAGESVEAHLLHHEPTIDERDEVRRHATVLVLTPSRLILAHTDEHAPDDVLPAPYTSSTTEAVDLGSVRTVVVNRMVANPETYAGASAAMPVPNEAVLSVGWGAVNRIDLEPASCGDPACEADHGYTGVLGSDDFSLRVSAAAEGPEAVNDLLDFARSLSARTVGAASVR
ncbi:MAG: FIG01121646: hypothetical protein [uncultured Nocardioidaceae bacterium]|uniref:Phosphodiesterase n=1 Tax=uncultured Nocardioidaceae bacterium TaxID=253824 RepID=A0A6J4M1E4_9ACTN|nr:MAG: FIG01121646: hypothetical protein [uncultured Nocardioidaceae bacterium]